MGPKLRAHPHALSGIAWFELPSTISPSSDADRVPTGPDMLEIPAALLLFARSRSDRADRINLCLRPP
jgi:hypothetical protein